MILKSTFCTLRVPYCGNAEFCWSERGGMVVNIPKKKYAVRREHVKLELKTRTIVGSICKKQW